MKAKPKKTTEVVVSPVEVLDQQFQPIIARAEAAHDLGKVADDKLNDVLAEIYEFGKLLAADENLAREFLAKHNRKYDAWAAKNIYQPLVQIAFAGRALTAGALSQRSTALEIMSREKPPSEAPAGWLYNSGGYGGVIGKFKGPSAIENLRKQNGGQITQALKPPLFDLHRAVQALIGFTEPMPVTFDKKVGPVPSRAFLIRNYEDSCRIDMVAVGHAFPCGRAVLGSPIPGLNKGAYLLGDSQATAFVHAFPQQLGWTATATATEATFTSPSGVVIKAEEISLVPHKDRLRACAQMRNQSPLLTLDACCAGSFRNWRRLIDVEYTKRKNNMQYVWSHRDSLEQWAQGARQPKFGPKPPLPVPSLPVFLDLEVDGGMTVGFHKANMPFGSPTFNMVCHLFGGNIRFPILPERQLKVADVERLCDAVDRLQVQALATFADTDVDQAALCVDAMIDNDELRFVLPTVISPAGNYASACDNLARTVPAVALPAPPQ